MTETVWCCCCAAIRQLCMDDCERWHRHRRGQPNPADEGVVCGQCRVVLANLPGEVSEAYGLLDGLEVPGTGKTGDGRSKNPEAPLPLVVDPVDLTADWRLPQGPIRRARLAAEADMQEGHMPVREVLWWRIRDVLTYRDAGETGPEPEVQAMCSWLEVRAADLADSYPPVDEYAAEMVWLRGLLWTLAGHPEPDERPRDIDGVPCIACQKVGTLARDHTGRVECGHPDCRQIWTHDEYEQRSKLYAAWASRNYRRLSDGTWARREERDGIT